MFGFYGNFNAEKSLLIQYSRERQSTCRKDTPKRRKERKKAEYRRKKAAGRMYPLELQKRIEESIAAERKAKTGARTALVSVALVLLVIFAVAGAAAASGIA